MFLSAYFTSVSSVYDEVLTDKSTFCFSQSVIPLFCLCLPVVNTIEILAKAAFNDANIPYTPHGEIGDEISEGKDP